MRKYEPQQWTCRGSLRQKTSGRASSRDTLARNVASLATRTHTTPSMHAPGYATYGVMCRCAAIFGLWAPRHMDTPAWTRRQMRCNYAGYKKEGPADAVQVHSMRKYEFGRIGWHKTSGWASSRHFTRRHTARTHPSSTACPRYQPGHWLRCLSPLTTLRHTVHAIALLIGAHSK